MIQELRVNQIEPNDYNPNVLKGEKFEALKVDVKNGSYDPILVSPKAAFYVEASRRLQLGKDAVKKLAGNRYVIVDGEFRWRAAVELGLTTIKAEIRAIPLFWARAITFRKNRERGSLDPLKEAKLFDSEIQHGVTEKQVAERYGVSRSYIAGRRSLLNLSAEVVELFESPEQTLKKRFEKEIRSDVEERRGLPEYVQVTDEEVEAHVEEQVAEVVPRGTLTPGHLKAIASLPKEQQDEIAEDVVHEGLNVRETEGKVKRAHKELELAKRFKEALEKARQKTCPDCGGRPKGFHFSTEERFQCSECNRAWEFMVTKEEMEAKLKKVEKTAKKERSKGVAKKRENPGYIRRDETIEQIDEKIKPWVLRKIKQLNSLESVKITGFRNGEAVHIAYPGSYHRGFEFATGSVKGPHDFWHQWKRRFSISMEAKDYKTLTAKSKIDLHVQEVNARARVEVHRFLDEIVNTDQDPFLLEKDVKTLLKKYGETKETA